MKATELMIGDWVQYDGNPIQVTEIITQCGECINGVWETAELYDAINIDNIQPIPLTPEILEKNGFNWGHTPDSEDYASAIGCAITDPAHWYYDEGTGVIEVSMPNESDGGAIQAYFNDLWVQFSFNQIYVHQLQHALRLCGIEKEIEL